jgi:hypothetical protein
VQVTPRERQRRGGTGRTSPNHHDVAHLRNA